MKRLALALLAACASARPQPAPAPLVVPPVTQTAPPSPISIPITLAGALRAHDASRVASFYAPNAKFTFAGAPHAPTDREQIARFYGQLFEGIPTFEENELASFESPPRRYSLWTHRGRGALSARSYDPNGLIVQEHMYFDELGSPPPEPLALSFRQVTTDAAKETLALDVMRKSPANDKSDIPLYDNTTDWRRAPEWFKEWKVGFPNAHQAVHGGFVAIGNFVFREDTMVGTFSGGFRGLAPSGREIELDEAWLYEIEGGRIARIFRFSNREPLDRQLGLRPSGPRHE